MDKKILFLILSMFLLLPLASAELLTFDNVVRYDDTKLKVDIINTFGLGTTYGSVELKSHKSVTEIKKVGYGDYQAVMYYDFSNWDLYSNGLGNVYFTDMRTGKEVDKLYYFAEWKEKTREVPIYSKSVGTLLKNGTTIYESEITDYKTETYWTWEKYNSKDIPETKLQTKRIALMVYVEKDDYTDAVWTIAGKKIKEHAEWSANLNVDLEHYYAFDGVYTDNLSTVNLTNGGTDLVAGKLGQGAYFEQSEADDIDCGAGAYSGLTSGGDGLSVNMWIKPKSFAGSGDYNILLGIGNSQRIQLMVASNGVEGLTYIAGGSTIIYPYTIGTGSWRMFTYVFDGTDAEVYLDGSLIITNTTASNVDFGAPDGCYWGARYSGGLDTQSFDGVMDEIGIWNRALSGDEITDLYNGGDGITYSTGTSDASPSVVINSPPNYDNLSTSTQTFNVTVTDNLKVQNVSLMQNGTIITTNTSQVNGTYIFTKSDTTDFYNWSIIAYDNNSQVNESDERFYTITIIGPTINLYSPENNLVTSTATHDFIGDAWDNFGIDNVSFYWDSALDQINTSGLNYSNYTFSKTLTEGSHTWYYKAYDNDSNPTTSAIRTIELDTLSPNITIVTPLNASDAFTSYVALGETAADLDLNWSVYDPNLDMCWFYNISSGLNETNTCNENQTFKGLSFGEYTIWTYANDTLGFESVNSTTFTFSYDILEYNRTYDATTIQTSTEEFELGLVKDSSVSSVTARFYYNNESYLSTRSQNGNSINFTNLIDIPSSINGTAYFYWRVSFVNETGSFSFNTTFSNQTIYNLSIEQCATPTQDGLTLNFTTYDSTNLTEVNSIFEANFYFFSVDGTGETVASFYYSNTSENYNNYLFCLNSGGENVTVSTFISYGATGYDNREYIIQNGTIGNFIQNIPLYLTLTDLTDIVTFTIQDQSYEPIADALVVVQRWNVGTDSYSTIGTFTTSGEGQGILDLELYTTWYRAVVYVDGVLTRTTDVQKLSSTSWIITLNLEEENPYKLFSGISADVSFNNVTNVTSYTWIDSSGYTRQGCLVVKNATSLGYVEIYNSCTTSTSVTIDYLVVGDGNYIAYGYIYLDEYSSYRIMDTESFTLGTPEAIRINSPYGSVISFLAIGTAGVIGVAAGSAILGVFLVVLMIFFLYWIGFLNITVGFIWGIITIAILIIFLQRRRGI